MTYFNQWNNYTPTRLWIQRLLVKGVEIWPRWYGSNVYTFNLLRSQHLYVTCRIPCYVYKRRKKYGLRVPQPLLSLFDYSQPLQSLKSYPKKAVPELQNSESRSGRSTITRRMGCTSIRDTGQDVLQFKHKWNLRKSSPCSRDDRQTCRVTRLSSSLSRTPLSQIQELGRRRVLFVCRLLYVQESSFSPPRRMFLYVDTSSQILSTFVRT